MDSASDSPSSSPSNSPGTSAITAQWQLNETAQSGITIAKGILRAATSDNVQPLAIIAADAFGATLAICQETQLKVEQAAKKNHTSYVVEFLRSSIGYAKDDCAVQLAASRSGLRFLGLAATLLCTADNYTASQALESMITSSAADGQLHPTTTQLRDLLGALEPKLNRTGFAESVVGWEIFITGHPSVADEFRTYNRLAIDHPSIEGIAKLVDALRDLQRLGDATAVEIRAGTCCPWVVAFIKWCLGEPPSIALQNGTCLVEQSRIPVTVVAMMESINPRTVDRGHIRMDSPEILIRKARRVDLSIAVYRSLDEPNELWSASGADQKPWFGMVSIQEYGKRRMRDYDLLRNRAFVQAITHSLKVVTTRLHYQLPMERPEMLNEPSAIRDDDRWTGSLPSELRQYQTTMFPSDSQMQSVLRKFVGLSEDPEIPLPSLQDPNELLSLPLVEQHMRLLEEDCKCEQCSGDPTPFIGACLKSSFIDALAQLTAEVIGLSLFDCIEPILVHAGGAGTPGVKSIYGNGFISAVRAVLTGRSEAQCGSAEILDVALSLIGHDIKDNHTLMTWVASEFKGQVVYPQLFDLAAVETKGILRLGGGPGVLFHRGSRFSMVCSQTELQWNERAKSTRWSEPRVDRLRNLMPKDDLEWQVRTGDGTLYLSCGVSSIPKIFEPHLILEGLAQSAFLRNCPHPEHRILEKPDAHSSYITPLHSNYGYDDEDGVRLMGRVNVVAAFGNDRLRFFALAGGKPGLIRGQACIRCCLDLCRRANFKYIIL